MCTPARIFGYTATVVHDVSTVCARRQHIWAVGGRLLVRLGSPLARDPDGGGARLQVLDLGALRIAREDVGCAFGEGLA